MVSYTILVEEGLVGGNVTTLVVNSSLGMSYTVTNLLPYSSYNFSIAGKELDLMIPSTLILRKAVSCFCVISINNLASIMALISINM